MDRLPLRTVFFNDNEMAAAARVALPGSIPQVSVQNELDLVSSLSHDSLVVAAEAELPKLAPLLIQYGCARFVSRHNFFQLVPRLVRLPQLNSSSVAVLAFLPASFADLVRSILSLFGMPAVIVRTMAEMQRVFSQQYVDYLVLDQDVRVTERKESVTSEQVIRFLRSKATDRSSLAVSVVKDFNHGSLYHDMGSSVRTVSNLMLSYAEYIDFLPRYLFNHVGTRIEIRFAEEMRRNNNGRAQEYLARGAKSFSTLLKDAKECYKMTVDQRTRSYNEHWLRFVDSLESLKLRLQLVSWLEDYGELIDEKSSRASAAVASASDESLAESESLIEKRLSLKKNIVLPQRILAEPNSADNSAGGPR